MGICYFGILQIFTKKSMIKRAGLMTILVCMFSCTFKVNGQGSDPWFPIYKDGKMGYINKNGKIVANPTLKAISSFSLENQPYDFIIMEDNELKYLISKKTGKRLIDKGYSEIYVDQKHRRICVATKENPQNDFSDRFVGWLDLNFKEVIPAKYKFQIASYPTIFHEGLWTFNENNLVGIIDTIGRLVIKPSFFSIDAFNNGYAETTEKKAGLKGLIDTKGNWILKPAYHNILKVTRQGTVYVQNTDKKTTAIINLKGQVVTDMGKLYIGSYFGTPFIFDNDNAWVQDTVTKKFGICDAKGKVLVEPQYDGIVVNYSNNLIIGNKGGKRIKNDAWYEVTGGKWYLMDSNGKPIGEPIEADKVSFFSEGMAMISITGKWGFINDKGKIIISPQFTERPKYFENGLARIYGEPFDILSNTRLIGYIDKTGKFIWPMSK